MDRHFRRPKKLAQKQSNHETVMAMKSRHDIKAQMLPFAQTPAQAELAPPASGSLRKDEAETTMRSKYTPAAMAYQILLLCLPANRRYG